MLTIEQIQAVADGLLDPSEAAKLDRRPGGRPKGSKQLAPDALDKAIATLAKQRSIMTADEIAASEYRIAQLLLPANKRDKAAAARATKEEKIVAGVYKRQEDRVGAARLRKSVDGKAGYVAEPHPECVPFIDVGLRMERHPNGWLAPITDTGKAGHAYAVPDATLAEHYAAWLSDPSAESDWSGCPLDEAGEFIPATYEHKVTNALTYAVCKAREVFPKANGTPVVHKRPLDSAAGCHRGAYRAPLARFLPSRRTAEEITPIAPEQVWVNGVHLDDLLAIASDSRPPKEVPEVASSVVADRRLDIVYSMADAGPASIVWFRDYVGPGPLHSDANECQQCGAVLDEPAFAGLCRECFLDDCDRAEGLR